MNEATTEAVRIVASSATVSDKIRALARVGYARAEIARLLGKRYQHIRNVLEGDKLQLKPATRASSAADDGVREAKAPQFVGQPTSPFYRLVVRDDGSLMLPREVRETLGVGPGDVVMGHLQGKDFSLTDGLTSARRAQALVLATITGEGSMADELIADRRREAAREMADD
jgi:hypothetical protein